ncbi:hypothetical protein NFI96_020752 [Prochilodus magdalenae]|nr:hypothetical protein NFI96_020752 [Prochilodus magdalenae]
MFKDAVEELKLQSSSAEEPSADEQWLLFLQASLPPGSSAPAGCARCGPASSCHSDRNRDTHSEKRSLELYTPPNETEPPGCSLSGPVLKNLRVLWLSKNKLEGLGGRVFRFAPALMEVYLDGNALRTLHDATFGDLAHLEVINLSGNQIPALPRRLLESITSTGLKTFDLEDNRVKHMPEEFFSSKPELPYVYLSQNPWICSCQVGYLRRYLEDQGHNVYKHIAPTGDIKASIQNDPESVVCF